MGGMADPNIYAPPPHVLRGRPALKGVVIDKGEPPNWGGLELRPFGTDAWLTRSKKPLVCYHVKFGCFESKSVRTKKGTPKIGERWSPAPCGRGVDPGGWGVMTP